MDLLIHDYRQTSVRCIKSMDKMHNIFYLKCMIYGSRVRRLATALLKVAIMRTELLLKNYITYETRSLRIFRHPDLIVLLCRKRPWFVARK